MLSTNFFFDCVAFPAAAWVGGWGRRLGKTIKPTLRSCPRSYAALCRALGRA